MTTRSYIVYADGVRVFRFTADLADPSAPILLEGAVTPFRIADRWPPRHTGDLQEHIARGLNEWLHADGEGCWDPDDDVDLDVEEDGRGRPPEDESGPQRRRQINLSDALADRARDIGDGNVSRGIRRALEAYPLR